LRCPAFHCRSPHTLHDPRPTLLILPPDVSAGKKVILYGVDEMWFLWSNACVQKHDLDPLNKATNLSTILRSGFEPRSGHVGFLVDEVALGDRLCGLVVRVLGYRSGGPD
jgi:hypothetical protein